MQTIKEWPNFLGGPHDTLFYDTLLFFMISILVTLLL